MLEHKCRLLKGALYRIYQVIILGDVFPPNFQILLVRRAIVMHDSVRMHERPSAGVADCLADTSRWLVKGIVQILARVSNAETCAIECRRGVLARV